MLNKKRKGVSQTELQKDKINSTQHLNVKEKVLPPQKKFTNELEEDEESSLSSVSDKVPCKVVEFDSSDSNEDISRKNKSKNTSGGLFIESKRKLFTLSVVIPSSVVDNAQSKEIKTYMIGEIARTLAMYRVDEIIIYHDNKTDKKDSLNYLITNLQYLETPQYLRKTLFPLSESLTSAGLMNPLDASHHLRFDEWCPYREGIVLNRPIKDGSWVNIGLKKECKINQKLEEKTRVTVKMDQVSFNNQLKYYSGSAVSSNEPKEKLGLYWGYFIRVAECIDDIFNQSTYNDQYDLIIGIGEKGKDYRDHEYVDQLDRFKRCLIFFGGIKGIEYTVDSDEKFKGNSSKIENVFNVYLNTLPDKGCRNIRTEEWMRVSLATLFPVLLSKQKLN